MTATHFQQTFQGFNLPTTTSSLKLPMITANLNTILKTYDRVDAYKLLYKASTTSLLFTRTSHKTNSC
ncbi:hypothetical protein OIU84_029516 [Salix udensis]|uniref:Uncharacterized protein n=1 Tax=Salix udensis TaxID=889485 RepID=A0AAD6K9J4_9ROSI|nr:hypothetical protein OIU84_029516 [Salix udensis]